MFESMLIEIHDNYHSNKFDDKNFKHRVSPKALCLVQ